MKRFKKYSIILMFCFGFLFTGTFCFFLYYFLAIPELPISVVFKLSLAIGTLCGLIFMLMQYQMNKSDRFWKLAKEFEEKVYSTNFIVDLENLYKNEFVELKNKAQGTPHYYECQRLATLITAKIKYI